MLLKSRKGIYFAFAAAIVSGIAVFLGSIAAKNINEPFVLSFLRNSIVAIMFSALLIGIHKWVKLKNLNYKQWGILFVIGLIGGSVPFLLFFKGLSLSSAATGAFIQKTLFIWVGILAIIFLKEKISKWQIFALFILIIGNYFIVNPKSWSLGYGELLILIATLFWAIETIILKNALKKIPVEIVSWGRMFFGSLIIMIFLLATNRINAIGALSSYQWLWVILPSFLLFAYVWLWFASLKHAPASLVSSILVVGSPITTILSAIFITNKYSTFNIIGMILIILGVIIFIKFSGNIKNVQKRQFTFR